MTAEKGDFIKQLGQLDQIVHQKEYTEKEMTKKIPETYLKISHNVKKVLNEVVTFKILKEVLLSALLEVNEFNVNIGCCKNLVTYQEALNILDDFTLERQEKFVVDFIELFSYNNNRQNSFPEKISKNLYSKPTKSSLKVSVPAALLTLGFGAIYLPTLSTLVVGGLVMFITDRGVVSYEIVDFKVCKTHDNMIRNEIFEGFNRGDKALFLRNLKGRISAEQASSILIELLDLPAK